MCVWVMLNLGLCQSFCVRVSMCFLCVCRIFRDQKRVARAVMNSQEEAFWRLHRPAVS